MSDLEMTAGEDVTLNVTIAPAVDITSWTISFTLARELNTAPPKLLTKAATITDGPAGIFTVSIASAETIAIAPGVYEWDAWRTDSGSLRRIAIGTFTLLPSARIPTS